MWGLGTEIQTLTKPLATEICEEVFPAIAKETLKITLGSGKDISLADQFFDYFEGRPLRYSKEKTILKMARIYEYTAQEVYKFKMYKEKLEILNNPNSYFWTHARNSDHNYNFTGVNSRKTTRNADAKSLNISRADSENLAITEGMGRGGASAINEDFSQIEKNWKNRDKIIDIEGNTRPLLDINLSEENPFNLDEIKTAPKTQPKRPPSEDESDPATGSPEVSYTNISLSKSVSNATTSGITTGKDFGVTQGVGKMEGQALQTNTIKKNFTHQRVEFVYGDRAHKALGLYVSNFRESFFSSFSSLFLITWNGY